MGLRRACYIRLIGSSVVNPNFIMPAERHSAANFGRFEGTSKHD